MFQSFFNIIRDKERGTIAKVFVEFGEEDVDACKIKIAKVNIQVGDVLKPRTQIGRLGVARHEEQTSVG